LGLPAALGHDVRAGGLAEARLGAGRGDRHVLVGPIGTGIAAAHVGDGGVFAGAHGAAGEIGHIVGPPGGPVCSCGLRGCLESIASAAAVARRYAAHTIDVSQSSTNQRPETGPYRPTFIGAARVAELAAAGDPVARGVWRETIDALADGLLTGVAPFDPEVVLVGGGPSRAGPRPVGAPP